MFAKIPRPSSTAATMVAKLSSASHHVGGFFGHVRAGHAHRHADVGSLQRGRVVDAVARHRHRRACTLQRLHNPQLVFGVDARIDGYDLHRPGERLLWHLLKLSHP